MSILLNIIPAHCIELTVIEGITKIMAVKSSTLQGHAPRKKGHDPIIDMDVHANETPEALAHAAIRRGANR